MRFSSVSAIVASLLLATAALGPVVAQSNPGASAFQNQFPDPLSCQPPVPEPPEIHVVSVEQIALPGPLIEGPRLVDGMIEVRTAAGLLRTHWVAGATPVSSDGPGAEYPIGDAAWAVSADGTHRARVADHRLLIVQKSCPSCDDGWRRRWRLRAAGLAQVPPVVTERRVYFGSADNQVYGVRRKNGHRAWATPLEGRVLRPLGLWVDAGSDIAALLAIPEPGAQLVLLDAAGGRPALHYRVQHEDDRFVGAAVATPDGKIVLARQGYAEEDAGLLVLEVAYRAPEPAEPGEIPPTGYNPPTPGGQRPATPSPAPN